MLSAAWPAEATRFLALRLSPGDDLRGGIEEAFAASGASAGFVAACIGSLSVAALRHAGRDEGTVTTGIYEVVGLSGTLSPDGAHFHAALSDEDGRMTGGHVLPGCVVRTTAEVVLALTEAASFTRPVDETTGYNELAFSPDDGYR